MENGASLDANIRLADQEVTCLWLNLKFYCPFHDNPPLGSVVSQLNLVLLFIYFWISQLFLPLIFSTTIARVSDPPCAYHKRCPFYGLHLVPKKLISWLEDKGLF
jgi:hypothetical protein